MRRILIDDTVKALADEYANELTGKSRKLINWRKMPKDKLKEFFMFLYHNYYLKQACYVFRINLVYEKLLVIHPQDFDEMYVMLFDILSEEEINDIIDYKGNKKKFYEHVIDCMRYADIRENLMRYYIQKLKIKTCVYCNAQYAITTEEYTNERNEKKRIGTYQFDHFYPESEYPFLCTSFFNLQPSCSTCNGSKSDRKSRFNLYTTNEAEQDVFWFELTSLKDIDSYMSDDMKQLNVSLQSHDDKLLENHQKLFHIDLIYALHKDVVQRVVTLMKFNKESYCQSLNDSIEVLFPEGVDDPEYFFFGYFMKKEHIHYQPLSKMVQDIVSVFRS